MKLSIFTTFSNPLSRGDIYKEAIACYGELADEVQIINGTPIVLKDLKNYQFDMNGDITTYEWPQEFSWEFIGQQFQRGYEACTGDWVIHCDLDWLFHQKDFAKIRQVLRDYPTAPAVSFYKWQFLVPDRYNLKSRLAIAVNRGIYSSRIKFDSGGDLCQPSLDGRELKLEEIPQAGVPFYCYEKLTKTEAQIRDDVGRMDRAWQRLHGEWLYSSDGTEQSAYEGWLKMIMGRLQKPHASIPLSDHPKYIQETLKNLTPEQWGYNGFGLIEGKVYAN